MKITQQEYELRIQREKEENERKEKERQEKLANMTDTQGTRNHILLRCGSFGLIST